MRRSNIIWNKENAEKGKQRSTDRQKIMRKLHGFAKDHMGLDDPHPVLHQLAVAEYDVESMAHCSTKELWMLYQKLSANAINWGDVEKLGVTRVPEMSLNQQKLIKNLQRELNWSDDYLIELSIKRYGYLHWKYLVGREAWAYCNYLIRRKREKKIKRKQDEQVPA